MLPNILLGYAFYDMAVSVQALIFVTNATNLNKCRPVSVQKCMICRPLHESLSLLMNSFSSVSEIFLKYVSSYMAFLVSVWRRDPMTDSLLTDSLSARGNYHVNLSLGPGINPSNLHYSRGRLEVRMSTAD